MQRLEKLKVILLGIIVIALLSLIGYILLGKTKENNQIVKLYLKDKGEIEIKLYPKDAPNTVANFLTLVNAGYYNGKIVYGKDPSTIHIGRTKELNEETPSVRYLGIDKDIKYNIDGEFKKNGFNNRLKHKKYAVTMGRANYGQIDKSLEKTGLNSAGGLFNIVMKEDAGLDGNYAVFGEVIKGQEILDEIYKSKILGETEENKKETLTYLAPFEKRIEIEKAESNQTVVKEVKWHKAFNLSEFLVEQIKKKDKLKQ